MPIFVIVMHAICNACLDLVLSRAAMLIKPCVVFSSEFFLRILQGEYLEIYFTENPIIETNFSLFPSRFLSLD